jgi:putative heme-binding domain-containing protein
VYWNYRPAPRPANPVDWEWTGAIGEALNATLADPDRGVRLAVLRRMQREKVPVSLPTLENWLADERDAARVAAILESLRDQPAATVRTHVETILRDAKHNSANRQAAMAIFLAWTNDDSSEKLLVMAESLEDGPILADVLRRLGKYPEMATTPLLVRKLNSAHDVVRAAAIETLGELKAEAAREKLVPLLAASDATVRRAAAVAAGKLEAKDAAESLLKLAVDSDPAVRRASFDALRILREPRAIPLAVAALKSRDADLTAIEFLREVGNPSQRNEVKDWAVQNPSMDVLLAATRALTEWRERKNICPLEIGFLNRAVAEIHGASGSLVRWNVTGPVAAAEAVALAGKIESADMADWKALFAAGTECRVTLAPKDAPADKVWLTYAEVVVSEPIEVELLASASGSFHVWLNGTSLLARDKPQAFRIDSDRLSARLEKGENRIVVQVGNAAQPEFHVRFRRKSATAELEKLAQAVLARAGNANRGRELFQNVEKSLCLKCHRLGEQGERTGPELTGVGSRFSRIYLAESILEPSRTIAPSFGTLAVLLADGTTKSGVKVAETETTLTLVDNQGQKHAIAKSEIDQQRASPLSTMPDGLAKRLSEEEFVDLVAFLAGQKETRAP